jgi:hypothetical protein
VCRNYPVGVSGFLILGIVVIFTVVLLRKKSIVFLHELLTDLDSANSESSDLLNGIVVRRERLITSVEEYFNGIINDSYSWEEIIHRAKLLKNNIRNFLVASEYFDVPLHIELYDLLERRSNHGAISRMEIYGTPPNSLNKYFNYRKQLELLEGLVPLEGVLVQILYEPVPRIHIFAAETFYQHFDINTQVKGEVFDVNFYLADKE